MFSLYFQVHMDMMLTYSTAPKLIPGIGIDVDHYTCIEKCKEIARKMQNINLHWNWPSWGVMAAITTLYQILN